MYSDLNFHSSLFGVVVRYVTLKGGSTGGTEERSREVFIFFAFRVHTKFYFSFVNGAHFFKNWALLEMGAIYFFLMS